MQAARQLSEQIAQISHRLAQMDRGSRRGAERIVVDEAIQRPLTAVLRFGGHCLRGRQGYGFAPGDYRQTLLFTLHSLPNASPRR